MISIYEWDKAEKDAKARIMKRAQVDVEAVADVARTWLERVQSEGDVALLDYIREFDDPDFELSQLRVSEEDIKAAYLAVSEEALAMIREQIRISKKYHEFQASKVDADWEIETVSGVKTGARVVPIDAVGLYVPAGKAPLPTVAQILTVAAKAAGVSRVAVFFPPTAPNNEIIVAAKEAGADEIYRVGGIAAIGAMTYGTETIAPVNFIAGPGSPYVQAAKLQVFGKVGIDMLSGPSEALILADETADLRYLAADILARCEHGPDSAGMLATTSRELAEQVKDEVETQALSLPRQEYLMAALDGYSAIVVFDSEEAMIEFANDYAAEHLEIQMKNPRDVLARIRNAGSVFLGDFAPVAVGDYASGTNHCLPTGVAPKFASPVNVSMFQKKMEFQELTREGLANLRPIVETIADVEGLEAHKRSVQIRLTD